MDMDSSLPHVAISNSHNMANFEKLDGSSNFHTWKFCIKNVLILEGLWDAVEGRDNDVARQARALARICLSVRKELYQYVRNVSTATAAWEKLSEVFEDKGLYRRVLLLRKLHRIEFTNFASMSSYIESVTTLVQQLQDIGRTIDDAEVAEILLSGLSPEYDTLVSNLSTATITNQISSELVKARLLQEYSRKTSNDNTTAYISKNMNHLRCEFCKKRGHSKVKCFKLKRVKKNPEAVQSNMVSALIATVSSQDFYLDSGATNHMVNNKEYFSSLMPCKSVIKMANSNTITCEGQGLVNLNFKGQVSPLSLSNVLYVPELSHNLISVSKLTQCGYEITFTRKGCLIYHRSETTGTGNPIACAYSNGLYKLNICVGVNVDTNKLSSVEHSLFLEGSQESPRATVTAGSTAELWHRRLGHLGLSGMKCLRDNACGIMFQDQDFKSCAACLEGKMSAASYPKGQATRASQPLELIHSDVCGPMQEPSWGGARYLVTFTDDYTRKTFGYLMKHKSEVMSHFINFKAQVEKQLGLSIKILRSDNGGEYFNKTFSSYLVREGIIHQSTVPYCPQQNGVSERLNRVLLDRVRCMLSESGLCKRYWGEAVMTAIYLKNRSPTVALAGRLPEEIWTGSKVDLSHLRVFGCAAYCLIPSQKRQKLDARGKKVIFLGYSETTKGYRLCEPSSPNTVILSRSVTFIENEFYYNKGPNSFNDNYYSISIDNSLNNNCFNDNVEPIDRRITNVEILNNSEINSISTNVSDGAHDDDAGTLSEAEPVSSGESADGGRMERLTSSSQASLGGEVTHSSSEATIGLSGRSIRERRPPQRYGDWDCSMLTQHTSSFEEPQSYADAIASPYHDDWIDAMQTEHDSLVSNQVWSLVTRPTNKNVIKCKWVYKLKHDADGNFDRFKARLVARGFTQKEGIDYNETFSPVVRHSSMRILFSLANEMDLEIDHLDVETAFLNGDLNEVIYMEQPEGFCDKNDNRVCLLQKSIYGLKQASKMWNLKVNNVLVDNGFKQSLCEPCIYTKRSHKDFVIVALYVDDFYVFYSKNSLIKMELLNVLEKEFNVKNLGPLRNCLGIRVTRDKSKGTLSLDQSEYIKKLLTRFNMQNCKPIATPMVLNSKLTFPKDKSACIQDVTYNYRQLIGSLMYLSVCTRPDIAFACSQLSQYSNSFDVSHWTAAKRILRYLAGTINYSLCYIKSVNLDIVAYTDADWGNDVNDRRSYTGFVIKLGNNTINWESRKQRCIALSSTEAEYLAIGDVCKDVCFIKNLLSEIVDKRIPCTVFNDNQSAQKLLECKEFCHKRTKHIDIRYHFVKDLIKNDSISVKYLSTDKMIADVLTKPLCVQKHCGFIDNMNLKMTVST